MTSNHDQAATSTATPSSSESSRRGFIHRVGAAGIGVGLFAAGPMLAMPRRAQGAPQLLGGGLPAGDVAILKFLAAAELVEDDLWQQYCELATDNPKFRKALQSIDRAMVRYICDDRDDERSHAQFINAFLVANGETAVNLDDFRTLSSSTAVGALQGGRLTNLTNLTVDTSWFNRYRSPLNPDLGAKFAQIATIVDRSTIPTLPRLSDREAKAAALSAAFHFCAIEQGGGSLYMNLIQKVQSAEAMLILASIGPTEIYHFATFHATLQNIKGFEGPDGLFIPNLSRERDLAQATFPEPCDFIDAKLPACSIIRPTSTANAGAVAAATGLVNSGLFQGQSKDFLNAVVALATAADAA